MSYSRSSVDEQVVKMSFDNSNFDSNVNQSINTLNSLDNKLSSLNKDNFSGLTQNWGNVADFFTVKGQVMFGILTRIGSEVVNLGLKFKNYLFKGIRDGIGEYDTIINSTQTVYQNVKQSGASIGDVNDALDELNDYADKTIYVFGQMTNMIGRFTSAGVGLNKSVSTIKGLANAAALVGATPEKAEMAWMAVSKAMSSGTFNSYTWRSLELSNIAGEQFRNVIIEVARANNAVGKSGKNIDELLDKYGDIKSSLQEGWLTKDIFNEAMQIMSGAMDDEALKAKGYTETQIKQLRAIADSAEEAATKVKTFRQLMDTLGEAVGSGWAQSFRILVGDLEQAKDLYTRISDVIGNFIDNNAKIRNNLFRQIMDDDDKKRWESNFTSGRESFRKTIENMMAIVKTFLKSVKTGFLNIFPIERIRDAARKVLDTVQKFTRALVINNEEIKESTDGDKVLGWDTEHIKAISEAVKDLIRFFRGLASAVDIAWMAISQPIKAIIERIPFFQNFFEKTNGGIVGLLKNLGKFGDKITVVRNAFKNTNFFGEVVGYLIDNIDELGKKYPVLGAILWIFKTIKNVFTGVKDVFKSMNIKPLATLFGAIKFIAEAVWKILNFIFSIFKSIKDSVDWSFLDGPKKALISFLQKLSDYSQGLISFEELTGKIGAKLKEIFSKLLSIFDKSNKASDKVTKSADKIQKAAGKTGSVLSSIWNKIKTFFGSIGNFFKKVFEGADFSFEGIVKKVALLAGGIAAAMMAVTHFSKTLAKISILKNINNLLLAGVDVVKAYERQIQSKMILNIAISIGILAAAMVGLAFVPYDKLENGLVVFSSFLAVLAVTLTPIITALAKFNESIGKARKQLSQYDVLDNLVTQLGKVGKKLARGFEFRMIGKMFKDVAISILIFVGALTALVFLFKYEEKNLIKSAKLVAAMIGAITIAVTLLIAVMERTSKVTKNTKATIGTFASFFKLAGVAKVILAISASVLVLAFAMKMMSKIDPDRLNTSFGYVMGLIGLLGAIAVGVAYFTSKAKDIGKLKKISVSMLGTMAGVAVVLLAMRPLIESLISDNDGKAWTRALIIFSAVIGEFTAMTVVMMNMAKKIGGGEKSGLVIWTNLEKFSLIMVAAMAAIAGVLFVISKMGDIPKNTMITIGIVAGVLLGFISLLALMTIVISKCKQTFSSNFATVVEKISFSIAAVVAAIGILAAGIGALIAALSSMNVPDTDVKKVQTNLLNKLSMIATIITDALPKLRKALYEIGWSVGSMFISFVVGFADSIVSSGETMLSIADKFVNLIIDLLGKVVDILYTRRYDIARIIKRALELIFAEITAVLNSFFKKKDGTGVFTEKGVAALLGFGGVTIAGVKGITEFSKSFNALVTSFEKMESIHKRINNLKIFKRMKFEIDDAAARLINFISKSKLIQNIGNTVSNSLNKIFGTNIKFTRIAAKDAAKQVLQLAGVVAIAFGAVSAAIHGLRQQAGKEAAYIRSDALSWWDTLLAMITDWKLLGQVLIETFTKLGEVIVFVVATIIRAVEGVGRFIIGIFAYAYNFIERGFWEIVKLFNKSDFVTNKLDKIDERIEKTTDMISKPWKSIGEHWNLLWTDSGYTNFIDGVTGQVYKDGYELGEAGVNGAHDGVVDNIAKVNTAVADFAQQSIDIARKTLDSHSPSREFEKIYRDVMLGSIQGIKDKEQDFYSYVKHVNDVAIGIANSDASALSEAYSDINWDLMLSEERHAALLSQVAAGTSLYAEAVRQAYGMEIGDEARKSSITIDRKGQEYEVQLNRELLNLTLQRAEAFEGINEGLDLAVLKTNIINEAEAAGINYTEGQVNDLLAVLQYATGATDQYTKFTLESFGLLSEATTASFQEVFGIQTAASDLALTNMMNNYQQMGMLAEAHKEELIGLKQEEVQEFLKSEAVQAGMSAQAAEDSSRMITATLFNGVKDRTDLTRQEFEAHIQYYQDDLANYLQYQNNKSAILQEAAQLREDFEAAMEGHEGKNLRNFNTAVQDMKAGKMTVTELQQAFRNAGKGAAKEWSEWNSKILAAEKAEKDAYNLALNPLINRAKDAGVVDVDAMIDSYTSQALNYLGKAKQSKYGSIVDIFKSLASQFGLSAPDVDLSWWDFKDELKDSSTLTDNDINTAVSAASDLKDGLESQRADLTPTFDLDQLASDAQKANGIVMSSLMAAQNASIGDYINQDSELNPFMKDRWQNVYNFTQNNYSPKALSRIDIYRQTQRQLSMSRGF